MLLGGSEAVWARRSASRYVVFAVQGRELAPFICTEIRLALREAYSPGGKERKFRQGIWAPPELNRATDWEVRKWCWEEGPWLGATSRERLRRRRRYVSRPPKVELARIRRGSEDIRRVYESSACRNCYDSRLAQWGQGPVPPERSRLSL